MEAQDGNFKLIFSSLERFYHETNEIEETGCKTSDGTNYGWDEMKKVNPNWVGLSKDEIEKSKYIYKEGLDQLKALEIDLNLGGKKRSYKWDETDGDDMNYDRFLENLPCLQKRINKKGSGHGKIINLHISIGENCGVKYKDMLNRSYTVMRVIDYLENMGYRVGVTVYEDVGDLGYYKGQRVKKLHVEIQIKKPEDPLIKGLILTCISPWMLRYHMFKLWTAKFKCNYGLGHALETRYKDTNTDIYFQTGSCLDKESCDRRIKELAEKFSFDE